MRVKYLSLVGTVALLSNCSASVGRLPFQEEPKTCGLSYEYQIEKDLSVFDAITPKLVEETFNNCPKACMYVEIKGGQIFKVSSKTGSFYFDASKHQHSEGLQKLAENQFNGVINDIQKRLRQVMDRFGPLPDMMLVFNLMDAPQAKKQIGMPPAPVFSFSKSDDYHDILYPYYGWYTDIDGWVGRMKRKKIEFDNKIDALVFRGAQSDGFYELHNWKEFPRSKLILACKHMPDKCDAGFHFYVPELSKETKAAIAEEVGLASSVPIEDFQNWKYIASLDGHAAPVNRYVALLASSSATFKQETPEYEFISGVLRPYVHYVPLAYDMSDLEEKIDWARRNPSKIKSIIKNANDFVDTQISQEKADCYFYKLLKGYASLQQLK